MSRVNAQPPGQGKRGNKVRSSLRRRDGDNCWICGSPMDFSVPAGTTPLSATRDHVVELSQGGGDTLGNQRLAHAKCNNDRSKKNAAARAGRHVILHLKFRSLELIIVRRKPPSSSGLGRRTLTPVTGVRISSGVRELL